MCILFFDVMVLGTLNGIFSPIVQGTGMLLRDQTFDLQKYQQEKDKLRADMMAKTMMTGRVFASNEELDAELDNMGWSEEEHTALQTMYEVSYAFSCKVLSRWSCANCWRFSSSPLRWSSTRSVPFS